MNLEKMKQQKRHYIMKFSVPAIIAMLLSAVVTVTDGYFIGNYAGREGLAAVNLGLPIVYLLMACGLMVGVGGSVIAGILNGNNQKKECQNVFNQTIMTSLVISAALSLLIFLFFQPMQAFLGAKAELAKPFADYYKIMLFYYPIMVLNSVFSMFIRAEGKPLYGMTVTIIGVIFNILFNTVFVHAGLGIKGIAWASMISGILSLTISILFFIGPAQTYRFGSFSFNPSVLQRTIINGSSEFVGEMASCISMFCYNLVIMHLTGAEGVSAFAIAGYTIFIFSMIVMGFGQGMSPLVSFAYGAKDDVLARNFRKLTNKIVFGVGMIFSVIMLLGVNQYSRLFVNDEAVRNMVREGVSYFVISFLLMGFNIIASMYFTSCGKAIPSAIISIARGIVILFICIFVLPLIWGMKGIWLAAPFTELLSGILSIWFLYKNDKALPISEFPS